LDHNDNLDHVLLIMKCQIYQIYIWQYIIIREIKSKTTGRTLIRIKDKRFDSLAFKDVSCHSAMADNVSLAFTCVGAF